jgi:hypothetical protein
MAVVEDISRAELTTRPLHATLFVVAPVEVNVKADGPYTAVLNPVDILTYTVVGFTVPPDWVSVTDDDQVLPLRDTWKFVGAVAVILAVRFVPLTSNVCAPEGPAPDV